MSDVLVLTKGERVNLTKVAPGVVAYRFGLGWDPQKKEDEKFDLDAILMMKKDGKATAVKDLVYFGNLASVCGAVIHSGDNLTGEGEGDDEVISVDTTKIDTNKYNELEISVVIFDAEARRQTFGQVDNAFIRVFNPITGADICRYDLTEDYSAATTVIVGKLYFKDGEWRFQAVGSGSKDGSKGIATAAGLNV